MCKKKEENFYREYTWLFRLYPWLVDGSRAPDDYAERLKAVSRADVP